MQDFELLLPDYEESARDLLRTDSIEIVPLPILGGFLIFDAEEQHLADENKRNKAATTLLSKAVFGEALIIPAGFVLLSPLLFSPNHSC